MGSPCCVLVDCGAPCHGQLESDPVAFQRQCSRAPPALAPASQREPALGGGSASRSTRAPAPQFAFQLVQMAFAPRRSRWSAAALDPHAAPPPASSAPLPAPCVVRARRACIRPFDAWPCSPVLGMRSNVTQYALGAADDSVMASKAALSAVPAQTGGGHGRGALNTKQARCVHFCGAGISAHPIYLANLHRVPSARKVATIIRVV